MKAKDLTLRVVNETKDGRFEIKEFKPYMAYETFIGCILNNAEILRPTGVLDTEGNMIYENCIIEAKDNIFASEIIKKYVIKYNDSKAKFEVEEIGKDIKHTYQLSTLNSLCRLKIIGNIYQNDESLNL